MQEGAGHRVQGFAILSIISTLSTLSTASTVTTSQKPVPRARRGGFSLIEILVAVTLLLIITVIISMVFQQAGGAWSSGTGKAKAESAVRAVLGSIERDLLNAVDARDYGFPNPSGSGSSISFIALQHLYNHKTPENSGRTPCLIVYTFGAKAVTRALTPLEFTGWTDPAAGIARRYAENTGSPYATASTPPIINSGAPIELLQFVVTSHPSDPNGLPLRVDITAKASRVASLFTVSGRSSGRNKTFEDAADRQSDDIRVGSKL